MILLKIRKRKTSRSHDFPFSKEIHKGNYRNRFNLNKAVEDIYGALVTM